MTDQAPSAAPGHLLRELAPQVLGIVLRRYGDFAASEDAVQEALIAAASQWPIEGVPRNPRAWLVHVAQRRMTDQRRADAARRNREAIAVSLLTAEDQLTVASEDDTLDLFFMCCHPALPRASAIALTLRAVGGLTTFEIARAFLVPEATMAQRISRAKQAIKDSQTPVALPSVEERATRLDAVMHVLYLLFSEGYTASTGLKLQRADLACEGIRLTRMLRRLLPQNAEVAGLLALMRLTDARRGARTGSAGELIALDEQDRTLWDSAAIAEGVALLSETLPRGEVGLYQLQAAVAAVHDEAPRAEDTDWPQILGLYGLMLRIAENPMIGLNHAVALAMVHGPEAGLARLAELATDPRLAASHRLDAVRGHLLERAGQREAAIEQYARAQGRTASTAERNYLLGRIARLRSQ